MSTLSTKMSDEELVKTAQQGNINALSTLYDRYYLPTYKRISIKVPQEDIEDITQEVFIAMGRNLGSFRFESRFNTWMITLTNRKIVDFYRRRKFTLSLDDVPDQIELSGGRQTVYSHIDDLVSLRKAFNSLPVDYQEVLIQRFINNLQFDQIAANFGISLDAIKSRFRRSVAALRNAMLAEDENGKD